MHNKDNNAKPGGDVAVATDKPPVASSDKSPDKAASGPTPGPGMPKKIDLPKDCVLLQYVGPSLEVIHHKLGVLHPGDVGTLAIADAVTAVELGTFAPWTDEDADKIEQARAKRDAAKADVVKAETALDKAKADAAVK